MKKMSKDILLECGENSCAECGSQLSETSSYTLDGEWESATIECLDCGELVKSTIDLIGLWEKAKSEDWEGIVIKNPNGVYEMKRSWNVLKIKCEKHKDIDFVSYEINNAGIRCESEDGIAIQITGSNSIPVKSAIDELGKCRVEVKYLNETKNKKLRMPVFSKIK